MSCSPRVYPDQDNDHNLKTDLKLASDRSNDRAHGDTYYESGVGANAASTQEMTFVAADCLSELVWSPNSGLSLKCTVAAVPEKRNSFFCGIGPSDMVLLSSHSIEGSFSDKVGEEREVHKSPPNSAVAKEECEENILSCAGDVQTHHTDLGCEDGPAREDAQETTEEGHAENSLSKPNAFDIEDGDGVPMVTDLAIVKKSDFVGEQDTNAQVHPVCPVEDGTISKPHNQFTHDGSLMSIRPSRCKEILNADKAFGEECLKEPFSRESLECTGENDVQPSGDIIADSFDLRKDSEKKSVQLEDCDPAIKASPIRALVLTGKGKGKEKALSDGDIQERTSEEEDNSYASVESCNSAGLITGKRKRFLSFEQQLIGGTKRIKRQSHENPCPMSSLTKCNSSFTNWMSTMIKGLSNSKAQNAASLVLPLAEHSARNDSQCSKDEHCKPSNMGFQSIFRSLYTSNSKCLDQGSSSPCNQLESCKELGGVSNPWDAAGPSSLPYDIETVKEIAGSSHSPDQCMVGDEEDPLANPRSSKEKVSALLPNCRTTSVSVLPIKCSSVEKDSGVVRKPRGSWNSSFVNLKSDGSGDDADVSLPYEEKPAQDTIKKKDPLTSLWVTRLYSKACSPIENPIKSEQTATVKPGSGDPKFINNSQSNVHFLQDSNVAEHKEQLPEEPSSSADNKSQSCGLGYEAHTTMERTEAQKVADPAFHPPTFTGSEDMASIFARRLDAFRQISSPHVPQNEAFNSRTCSFCGSKGHDLQDCSQVSEVELAELLRNMSAYGGAEESACLCIRCFELNHWAVACPNIAPKKPCELDIVQHSHMHRSSTENLFGFGKVLTQRDAMNYRILEVKENTGASSSQGFHRNPSTTEILSVDPDTNAGSTSVKWLSTSTSRRPSSLSQKETAFTLPRLSQMCNSVGEQVRNTPEDIFKAVKKLRLSRSDLLKWMTNPSSLPRLHGYYLRLRLGNWERGFRGTGYYVACIVGFRGGANSQGGRGDSITVMVRGMRCLVECHNISNQDFLEDELIAWWSGLLRDGGNIPSEDALRSKWEERRRLGF